MTDDSVRALTVVDGDSKTLGCVSIDLIKQALRAGREQRDDAATAAVSDT
jgi:hypothetical protein